MAAKYNLKLPYTKELAEVRIEEVAKIAAMLLRESGEAAVKGGDEKDRLVAATGKAFALLEIAYYGKRGLTDKGSYAAGLAELAELEESAAAREEFLEIIASLPKWGPEYGADGRPLAEPFDKGLKELIPLPGVSASKATDTRMVRFKAYLAKLYRDARPEQDEQERMIEVGERIEQMQREGIPAGVFFTALRLYSDWWDAHQREQQSVKGKRGQKKRAKQAASEPKQAQK